MACDGFYDDGLEVTLWWFYDNGLVVVSNGLGLVRELEIFSRRSQDKYIKKYIYIKPKNDLSYLYYSPQQQQPSLSINIFGINKLLILNEIRNFLKRK